MTDIIHPQDIAEIAAVFKTQGKDTHHGENHLSLSLSLSHTHTHTHTSIYIDSLPTTSVWYYSIAVYVCKSFPMLCKKKFFYF